MVAVPNSILGGRVGPGLQESGGLPAFCCCLVTIKGLFHPQVEANYRAWLAKVQPAGPAFPLPSQTEILK